MVAPSTPQATALQRILAELAAHKLLAVRAVVVGWAATLGLWRLLAMRLAHVDDWLHQMNVADIRGFWQGGRAAVPHLLIGGAIFATAGWIVGRLHRLQRVPMVVAFFGSFVLIADVPRVIDVVINPSDGVWNGLYLCLLDFVFMTLPILVAGTWEVGDPPVNTLPARPVENRK